MGLMRVAISDRLCLAEMEGESQAGSPPSKR